MLLRTANLKKKKNFMINIAAGIITVITTIITVWIGACQGSFGEGKVTACSWEKGLNVLEAIRRMTQGPFLFYFCSQRLLAHLPLSSITPTPCTRYPQPFCPSKSPLLHAQPLQPMGPRYHPSPEAPRVKGAALEMQGSSFPARKRSRFEFQQLKV